MTVNIRIIDETLNTIRLGGTQGPPGIIGPTGPTGPQGVVGPRGDSFDIDAVGVNISERDQYDGEDEGFSWLQVPTSGTTSSGVAYFRYTAVSGVWSGGIPYGKGDQGDTGDTGASGIQGPQGETGASGIQGPVGPAGPQGNVGPGTEGSYNIPQGYSNFYVPFVPTLSGGDETVRIVGAIRNSTDSDPSSFMWTVKSTSVSGAYIELGGETENGNYYFDYIAGSMAGISGADGAPGASGIGNARWWDGSGAPGGGLGAINDYYLDGDTGDVYKRGGSWASTGTNIQGPTGAAGPGAEEKIWDGDTKVETTDPTGIDFHVDGTFVGRFTEDNLNLSEGAADSGLILGNTTTTSGGAVRWNGANFEGYNGASWVELDQQDTIRDIDSIEQSDDSTNYVLVSGDKISLVIANDEHVSVDGAETLINKEGLQSSITKIFGPEGGDSVLRIATYTDGVASGDPTVNFYRDGTSGDSSLSNIKAGLDSIILQNSSPAAMFTATTATCTVAGALEIGSTIKLAGTETVDEFDTDNSLAADSDSKLATQKATKYYADNRIFKIKDQTDGNTFLHCYDEYFDFRAHNQVLVVGRESSLYVGNVATFVTPYDYAGILHVQQNAVNRTVLASHNAGVTGSQIHFVKSQGTVDSPTVMANNTILGSFEWAGLDNASNWESGVKVYVEGTPHITAGYAGTMVWSMGLTEGTRTNIMQIGWDATDWGLTLENGVQIDEFSDDDTLAGDSDRAVPTEQAVKAYVDNNIHTRSHSMTSTSDHTAGNYKMFVSDGSGEIQELTNGAADKVLTGQGVTSSPSWEDPVGAAAGDLDATTIVVADHGTAATDQVVNVCYGTGSPPTASTTTEGALFFKYTA